MQITMPKSSHLGAALRGLLSLGWRPTRAPHNARLVRNGQLIKLLRRSDERAVRLFVYKVTGSGRSIHERRVEITSTYKKNLQRAPALYEDIVLGYEPELDIFVGIDARRIKEGGRTGNASSFVDPNGLADASSQPILILPRKSDLFEVEYCAYFQPWKITEYLFNAQDIHAGRYDGRGLFSGNRRSPNTPSPTIDPTDARGSELFLGAIANELKKQPVWKRKNVWSAFESRNANKLKNLRVTQEDFMELYKRQMENGTKGEEFVLKSERERLNRAGRSDLAALVVWRRLQPFLGYDIKSFETNGKIRYIEVKATSGSRKRFAISPNEWRLAAIKRDRYYIYRVTKINTNPDLRILHDPFQLEVAGLLILSADGLLIDYQ